MTFDPVLIGPRRDAMKRAGFWGDKTINDYLDACVAAVPDKEAIVDFNSMSGKQTRLTYRQLADRVERMARNLRELGIGCGDVVSFQLPNWWQFSALYLAIARIGAVVNPLMPIFRERELSFMLALAGSKVLVVPRRFRDFDYPAMIEGIRDQLPQLGHVFVIGGDGTEDFDSNLLKDSDIALDPVLRIQADEVTQILYTSGTTGEPKGVMHTSNTLLSNLKPYADRLGLGADDVILMASPMAHQTGFLYGLMMPVMLQASAVLQDIWNPTEAAETIRREGVTFTMASTPFLSDLTETVAREGRPVPSLKVFLSAGAPIPRPLVAKAKDVLGTTIVSAWGMTENGAVTLTKLDDPESKAISTDGCCLPGVEVKVVDQEGNTVPSGEEGELLMRGCSLFAGYHKRPEWNNVNAEGWFNTGDLARMDEDGYIRITGRSKDVVIRGGENIPVVEIENLLFKHPSISAVAIVGYPDPRLGERAVAFVTLREGASLTKDEMIQHLLDQKCAKQYLPERLEIMDELPRTPSGKIQKFRLREIAQAVGS